jgi:chromosome segregation ATPase
LKELEKALPSVASINGMAVKDFIKDLTDENRIHVEKIGSANWYWCWADEDGKQKREMVDQLEQARILWKDVAHLLIVLRKEASKIESSNAELQQQIQVLREKQSVAASDPTHQALFQQLGTLEEEVKALRKEKDGLENAVSGGVEEMTTDIAQWKIEIGQWTDNIYSIESYLADLAGGDKETMEAMRRECYGKLYIEGEALPELDIS